MLRFTDYLTNKQNNMIKVTVGEQKTQEKSFPKLMITTDGSNRVVFFLRYEVGVQLNICNDADDKEPHYAENWAMDDFTDIIAPITIQNA